MAIKTHYISAMHVVTWLEMQKSEKCRECFFLLNNEDGIWEHCKQSIPREMHQWILPFTSDSFIELGLPIVPARPRWRNSHKNGDYGFYLLSEHLGSDEDDRWLLLLDQDLGLVGNTWSQYLDALPWDSCDAIMLTHNKSSPRWDHYNSASKYFDVVYSMLWGLTAIRLSCANELLSLRLDILRRAEQICADAGLNLYNLNHKQAWDYWPICEAVLASYVGNKDLRVHRILRPNDNSKMHYTVRMEEWDNLETLSKRVRSGETVLFHPLKEPTYGWQSKPS